MASFQNTFRNERGITSSSPSSNSSSTSSSSQEFNYYDDDDDNTSNSIINIIYKLFWGIPSDSRPTVSSSSSSVYNDACCDLRN
jgi:hypothetical protein